MCVVAAVVVVLLVLALVFPTQVARMATVFLVAILVRSRRLVFATVADHACLPMSVSLTVFTELSDVRDLITARVNERVSTLFECVRVLVAV